MSGKNFKPSGISSFISVAYPSIKPSLYTLIVYVTILLFSTSTGSLVWSYFMFPSSPILNVGYLFVTSWSSTAVINFLKAKSKYTTLTFSKSSSSSCPGIYSVPLFISSSL